MKNIFRLIAAFIAIGIIGMAIFILPQLWLQRKARHLVGAPEAEVVASLGDPYKVITASEAAAIPKGNPLWPGWQPSTGSLPVVTNKAFIYLKPPLGVIIFIGLDGKVEHVSNIGT